MAEGNRPKAISF